MLLLIWAGEKYNTSKNPRVFSRPNKKILASFIDPKKSLLAKISDPKKPSDTRSLKYLSGSPGGRWLEHGENSKYFLNLERNNLRKHIRKLYLRRVLTTDPSEILDASVLKPRNKRDLWSSRVFEQVKYTEIDKRIKWKMRRWNQATGIWSSNIFCYCKNNWKRWSPLSLTKHSGQLLVN